MEQFQRLTLLAAGEFAYALTGNGATLLCGGQVDADWQRETKRLIADALDELAAALRFLQQVPTVTLAPRLVDEAFVYAKSSHCLLYTSRCV